MTAAREEILRRIKWALRDVPPGERPEEVAVERGYTHKLGAPTDEILGRFVERVAEYKATVTRVPEPELPAAILQACRCRQVRRLVVPADLPTEWLPDGVTVLNDEGLPNLELDRSDGVLTGCALGIAQTGTIVLDGGPGQGRRITTLLPDYHLCVVHGWHVVDTVPEAIERLERVVREERRPITLLSGPSATSDIELNRVEGVHGPRTLQVIVVG